MVALLAYYHSATRYKKAYLTKWPSIFKNICTAGCICIYCTLQFPKTWAEPIRDSLWWQPTAKLKWCTFFGKFQDHWTTDSTCLLGSTSLRLLIRFIFMSITSYSGLWSSKRNFILFFWDLYTTPFELEPLWAVKELAIGHLPSLKIRVQVEKYWPLVLSLHQQEFSNSNMWNCNNNIDDHS